MKNLIILTVLLSSVTSFAASVECARGKKFLRPISKDAIKLAKHLNVTTCNGKRFKAIVKDNGLKIKTVNPTPEFIKKYGQPKKALKFSF